jgi:hypothetical protein
MDYSNPYPKTVKELDKETLNNIVEIGLKNFPKYLKDNKEMTEKTSVLLDLFMLTDIIPRTDEDYKILDQAITSKYICNTIF